MDGDEVGGRYAAVLRDPAAGAAKVLRWPEGWTIEDIVGWIIEADESAVMMRINADLAVVPGDRFTLVAGLKSEDREQHGIKSDRVAHEIIANALTEHPPCLQRARAMLHALAQASAGAATPYFEADEAGQVPRLVFQPWP